MEGRDLEVTQGPLLTSCPGTGRGSQGCSDGTQKGWDAASDAELRVTRQRCRSVSAASVAPALLGKGMASASDKHVQTSGKLPAFRPHAPREKREGEGTKIKRGLQSTLGEKTGFQSPGSAECRPTPPSQSSLSLTTVGKQLIKLSQPLWTRVRVSVAGRKPQPQPQSSNRAGPGPPGAPSSPPTVARPRSDGPEASAAA